jgi:hypothetical protein
MQGDLPAATEARIQSLAAEGRARVEEALRHRTSRAERVRVALLRMVGAIAIGTAAAGFSILAMVVLLNLVMHFSPS